jgi:glyoxylase-like metal-dependent hydrolase (beta-lactamase superfamily II)
VWRLRLPLPWRHITHVNAYAVEREDGVMLVDCGTAGDESCRGALEHALHAAGYSLTEVRLLAGTHVHSDHVGLAEWVLERSGAELWTHPATAAFYDAIADPEGVGAARERRARAEGVPEDLLADYRDVREETEGVLAPVEPDRHLRDGVRLPSALGDWEVVETPGHAPSHVCLVQREHGLAILGDLVSAVFAPYFDYGYPPDPVGELLASLDRIAREDLRLGLPGHGRPIDDVAGAIALQQRGVADRLAAVERAVADGAGGAYEITRAVFGAVSDGELAVWQLAEVVAYLRHLRLAGRVERGEDARGRFRYGLDSAVRTKPS